MSQSLPENYWMRGWLDESLDDTYGDWTTYEMEEYDTREYAVRIAPVLEAIAAREARAVQVNLDWWARP